MRGCGDLKTSVENRRVRENSQELVKDPDTQLRKYNFNQCQNSKTSDRKKKKNSDRSLCFVYQLRRLGTIALVLKAESHKPLNLETQLTSLAWRVIKAKATVLCLFRENDRAPSQLFGITVSMDSLWRRMVTVCQFLAHFPRAISLPRYGFV